MRRPSGRTGETWDRDARRAESGNAMVVALLVLLVMTTAGVAYVAVTKSEKQIAGNTMSAAQALYAAEAGITEGLHRMAFQAESTNYIGPTGNPTPGWGRYIVIAPGRSLLDPDGPALQSDGMDNNGNLLVDEPGERYPEVLTKQTVNAQSLIYPYVRLEFRTQGGQLVRFGDADLNPSTPPTENLTKGAPVLRITARGRRGNADKTLEAEAVRFPLVQVESAVWAGGHLTLGGNAFVIDAHDHYATIPFDTIPGAATAPGILTEGATTDVPVGPNQDDNVTGTGGNSSIQQSTYSYNFNSMWTELTSMADYSFTGNQTFTSATPAYGSLSNPKITTVKGNLSCGGTWGGGGILIVNGNLAMGGGSRFEGIVIVLGDISIAGGGPADVAHIVGGLIYQGTLVDASFLGGAAKVYYSSEAINAAHTLARYTLSWWRER